MLLLYPIQISWVKILCVLYLHYIVAFTFIKLNIILKFLTETKHFIPKGVELGTRLSYPIRSIDQLVGNK